MKSRKRWRRISRRGLDKHVIASTTQLQLPRGFEVASNCRYGLTATTLGLAKAVWACYESTNGRAANQCCGTQEPGGARMHAMFFWDFQHNTSVQDVRNYSVWQDTILYYIACHVVVIYETT